MVSGLINLAAPLPFMIFDISIATALSVVPVLTNSFLRGSACLHECLTAIWKYSDQNWIIDIKSSFLILQSLLYARAFAGAALPNNPGHDGQGQGERVRVVKSYHMGLLRVPHHILGPDSMRVPLVAWIRLNCCVSVQRQRQRRNKNGVRNRRPKGTFSEYDWVRDYYPTNEKVAKLSDMKRRL